MNKTAIVDFNGYYYNRKFIIKEICTYVRVRHRDRGCSMINITKPPQTVLPNENKRAYRYFKKRCGISWQTGDINITLMREKIINLFLKRYGIYVKNDIKRNQLLEFIEIENYPNIFSLDDFGYGENSEPTRVCSKHISQHPGYYCAPFNTRKMVNWLFNLQKSSQAVIDFNGHYTENGEFMLKELSIFGLNENGEIVYHNFFVFEFSEAERSPSIVGDYYDNYYKKYGIEWEEGSHERSSVKKIIDNLFAMAYLVSHIFVKNENYRNQLEGIIDSHNYFICLNNLDYKEDCVNEPPDTECLYHTRENVDMNYCADAGARKMVDWIVEKKYYESRNVDARESYNTIMQRAWNIDYKFGRKY